jgi:hypothetical protein
MAKKELNIAPVATPVATPENTPVPGGGRYRWSDTAPHWTEIDEDGAPVVAAPTELPVADSGNSANPV